MRKRGKHKTIQMSGPLGGTLTLVASEAIPEGRWCLVGMSVGDYCPKCGAYGHKVVSDVGRIVYLCGRCGTETVLEAGKTKET